MVSPTTALSQAYPLGTTINERGHLQVGGCDVVEIAGQYGTPAYIYAEDDMRARARAYVEAFAARTDDFEVIYASKALPITAAYRVMAEEGLSVDVASGGELYLALKGGVSPQRIFMHGNNKARHELELAFEAGIGYLVLDSFQEIELANELLAGTGRRQPVLIRLTPGIKPSTHSYIQTGQIDSKFGFGMEDGLAAEAVRRVQASERLDLVGVHAHIGSQIFELEPYAKTIRLLADFVDATGIECRSLNVGGGLGIAYTAEDEPASIEDYADVKVRGVQQTFDPVPRILVEPGRSLVGNAGLTAYRIGTIKEVPGVRTYVSVDGGMSDNLRPMLYGARYEAAIANRPDAPGTHLATIAGMHCESGDILIRDVSLPAPQPGEVLVTPATGAYGYTMASNYNGVPRPPVIFCKEGRARVVVRRETYEDLAARDA
jgi:diaminopimelate decarboxylase